MPAPSRDLPVWASTANFPEILDENGDPVAWSEQPTREPTGMSAVAAQGHIPDDPTDAETFNDWLGLTSEVVNFLRDEAGSDKFGDGSDGDVTLSTGGTTTLTRDMYYNNLTISHASRVVESAGFRIFVAGTLTMVSGATIQNNGDDAPDDDQAGAEGAPTRYSDPINLQSSFLGGGDGADAPVTTNTAGTQADPVLFRLGGAGGAGGDDGAGNAGGAAQTGSLTAPERGGWRHFPRCVELRMPVMTGDTLEEILLGGGVGGSSGGNDGAGGGTHAGSGGGGGGVVCICARRAVLAAGAIIRANGGDGGDAFNAPGSGGTGSGGGGGGGGGVVVFICRDLQDSGATIEAVGGTGGAGDDTGVAGDDGEDGLVLQLTG